MDELTNLVILGKVGVAYGLEGWLKVTSYTDPMENLLDYSDCYLGQEQHWQEGHITQGRRHGKGLVAHFQGYDTPEVARNLTGKLIGIPRKILPKPKKNEYYWHDLVGLTVMNLDGQCLGKITQLLDIGPHDILVIRGESETLIPFIQGVFVKAIDLDAQTMTVDWQPDSFTYT